MRRWTLLSLAILATVVAGFVTVVAPVVDRRMNTRSLDANPVPSDTARALHATLAVVDLHADALLWPRDITERHAHGHVDLPRLIDGNVAVQVFSVVTKTPRGINYERNDDRTDNITLLALAERYPPRAWRSLRQRALWQANRLYRAAASSDGRLHVVTSGHELDEVMRLAQGRTPAVAAVLATEGLHPLEGEVASLDTLFAAGFRMFGFTHFFDNEVGGSAHGVSRGGLTPLGRDVVRRIDALGGIIDVAHASPTLVDDILATTTRPVVVSHGGVQGTCPGPRNLTDDQLRRIAARGGLVGIGLWDGALCEPSLDAFARAVRHAVGVAGDSAVALGSDFDGATRTPIDAAGLPAATDALLKAGLTADQVRAVMGGNAIRFLRTNLPP